MSSMVEGRGEKPLRAEGGSMLPVLGEDAKYDPGVWIHTPTWLGCTV